MLEQSWLIDGKPAKWSAVFNVAHISVVTQMKSICPIRNGKDARMSCFEVIIGGKEIVCCREDMGPEATENFRTSLIIAWGAALEKQP